MIDIINLLMMIVLPALRSASNPDRKIKLKIYQNLSNKSDQLIHDSIYN